MTTVERWPDAKPHLPAILQVTNNCIAATFHEEKWFPANALQIRCCIGSCCGQSRPLESWMSWDQHLHLHSLEAIRHQVCCVTSSHVSFQILTPSVKLRQRWLHLRDFCQLSTPLVAFLEGDKASRLRQWETVFTSGKKIHLAADHPTTMGTFHRKVSSDLLTFKTDFSTGARRRSS